MVHTLQLLVSARRVSSTVLYAASTTAVSDVGRGTLQFQHTKIPLYSHAPALPPRCFTFRSRKHTEYVTS